LKNDTDDKGGVWKKIAWPLRMRRWNLPVAGSGRPKAELL
jgi:hypothetical protein